MKIRITGTKPECRAASDYYQTLRGQPGVKYVCISGFYPNRGSDELYRVYIEVEYYETAEPAFDRTKRLPHSCRETGNTR